MPVAQDELLSRGRIADIAKGSVATAALFLAFISVPFIGMFPGLFVPAPGVYYALKSGRITGLAVVLIMVVLLALLGDPTALAIYLLQAGVVSLSLFEFLSRRVGGARSIVYSVAVNLAVILAVVAVFGTATGTDLHAKILKGINASISQSAAIYEKMGVKGDELKAIQESMHQAGSVVVTVYPALLTVALGMLALLNLALVARLAGRNRVPVYLGDFRRYRNPEPMIWLLIAAGFGLMLPQGLAQLTALNVTIILCALYCVQGFAVVSYYFSRFAIPLFVRAAFIVLLLFQPLLTLAVAVLGIFDLWGNFRHPRKKRNL